MTTRVTSRMHVSFDTDLLVMYFLKQNYNSGQNSLAHMNGPESNSTKIR